MAPETNSVNEYTKVLREKAKAFSKKREGLVEKATDTRTIECFERADLDIETGIEDEG